MFIKSRVIFIKQMTKMVLVFFLVFFVEIVGYFLFRHKMELGSHYCWAILIRYFYNWNIITNNYFLVLYIFFFRSSRWYTKPRPVLNRRTQVCPLTYDLSWKMHQPAFDIVCVVVFEFTLIFTINVCYNCVSR